MVDVFEERNMIAVLTERRRYPIKHHPAYFFLFVFWIDWYVLLRLSQSTVTWGNSYAPLQSQYVHAFCWETMTLCFLLFVPSFLPCFAHIRLWTWAKQGQHGDSNLSCPVSANSDTYIGLWTSVGYRMNALCIHLSLRRWQGNEKIESEWWIYKHSLQRRPGKSDYHLGSLVCTGFALPLQPGTHWPNVEYFFLNQVMIALTYNFIHPSDPTPQII